MKQATEDKKVEAKPEAKAEVKVEAPVAETAAEPVEELVSIVLDLPKAAGGALMHAGRTYLPRIQYRVPKEVARDLLEMESRCKAHESSLHESENKGRRPARAAL